MSIIYPPFFDSKAGKLEYVYHDKPIIQVEREIRYHSPYLGINRVITYHPREAYGMKFDNVKAIKINDNLIMLREIIFYGLFPDDIREIAKRFSGRLPNEEEIKLIFEQRAAICNNLLEIGEHPLRPHFYLFNKEDNKFNFNYCLDFASGREFIADCDDTVAAVLVA